MKSILVFSHDHNSFDKKDLLLTPNSTANISDKKVDDFVKNQEIKKFFIEDIDELLKNYELGRPENKPDVSKQIQEIKERREEMIKTEKKKIEDYNNSVAKLNQQNNGNKITELTLLVKELTIENNLLNDKVKYLENKIKELISLELERKRQSILSTSNLSTSNLSTSNLSTSN
jgi:hypothetical protein